MIYIESPNKKIPSNKKRSLFLAGGITDCPDWQSEVAEGLSTCDIEIFNPRRADFPMGDPNAGKEQIKWEFDRLDRVSDIMFWFCRETVCPIVLYEIGRHLAVWQREGGCTYRSRIYIGMDPHYSRRFDVEQQSWLTGWEGTIHFTLDDLVKEIRDSFQDGK